MSYVAFHTAVQMKPASVPEYSMSLTETNKSRKAQKILYTEKGVLIDQGDYSLIVPLANVSYARISKEARPEDTSEPKQG